VEQVRTTDLQVDIVHIPEEGRFFRAEISASALQLDTSDDVSFAGPIGVQGRFTKTTDQIYFQGTAYDRMVIPCSRCLEATNIRCDVEICVVFLPATSFGEQADEAIEVTDEPDLYIHDGLRVDLGPVVHDQVVLSIPLQPLCRPDCEGLCQVCGGNLNEAVCACRIEVDDPRFAPLKQLSFPESS
jgi:uncharacterized protein